MAQGYFMTGTDTEIGKTWCTLALMRALQAQGNVVVPMKPVASGCEWREGSWQNDDALQLMRQSSIKLDYAEVNPYAFPSPISPHLAAREVGQCVDVPQIVVGYRRLAEKADYVLVEGAGGWLAPLTEHADIADLAVALGLPVILVVGMRLGCLNHAKLTLRAIRASGLPVAGWLANCLDPAMRALPENIATLRAQLDAPCLGVVPHGRHDVAWSGIVEKSTTENPNDEVWYGTD